MQFKRKGRVLAVTSIYRDIARLSLRWSRRRAERASTSLSKNHSFCDGLDGRRVKLWAFHLAYHRRSI